jgi:hypothetical protein
MLIPFVDVSFCAVGEKGADTPDGDGVRPGR